MTFAGFCAKLAALSTSLLLSIHLGSSDVSFTLVQKHSQENKRTQGSNKQGGQVEPETKPGAYNK
jgi:hypothetical protein